MDSPLVRAQILTRGVLWNRTDKLNVICERSKFGSMSVVTRYFLFISYLVYVIQMLLESMNTNVRNNIPYIQ